MKTTKSILRKMGLNKAYNIISMPSVSLTEEEADRFITYIFDQSVLKKFARIVRMRRPQQNIRAMGFGSGQFLYPEGQFDSNKHKEEWAENKIQLSVKKARGAITVYDDDIEDIPFMNENQWTDQLMRLVAEKISHELEHAYWMGDTQALNGWAATTIESMWDGWRYQIAHSQSGQTYENAVTGSATILKACQCISGADCPSGQDYPDSWFRYPGKIAERALTAPYDWEFKYHKALKAMPSKYKAMNGLANMKFLNSDLVTQDYLEALSNRGTMLGDAVFKGDAQPAYGKVGILDAPLMPTDLGLDTDGGYAKEGTGDKTDVLLTLKNNLIIGILRDIKIETDRDAANECTYIYYSLRTDLAIENVHACVMVECLEHEC